MVENTYYHLIIQQLKGEISPEDNSVLNSWLSKGNNQAVADQVKIIWERSSNWSPVINLDMEADFKTIQAKISENEIPHKQAKKLNLGSFLMRIAAVSALILFTYWGWQQFDRKPNIEMVSAAEGDQNRKYTLPDGSVVWLRKGATLAFDKAMGTARSVNLKGEAYFEVVHNAALPFVVNLEDGGHVTVLGTSFDVVQTPTSNAVILKNGKVKFTPVINHNGIILTPGMKAVYDKNKATVTTTNLTSFNELSWQTGGLEFVKTPLRQVIKDLELYYNTKITLSNPTLAQCLHTAPLTHQPLDEVLDALSLTYQLQVIKSASGTYELRGGNCK